VIRIPPLSKDKIETRNGRSLSNPVIHGLSPKQLKNAYLYLQHRRARLSYELGRLPRPFCIDPHESRKRKQFKNRVRGVKIRPTEEKDGFYFFKRDAAALSGLEGDEASRVIEMHERCQQGILKAVVGDGKTFQEN